MSRVCQCPAPRSAHGGDGARGAWGATGPPAANDARSGLGRTPEPPPSSAARYVGRPFRGGTSLAGGKDPGGNAMDVLAREVRGGGGGRDPRARAT